MLRALMVCIVVVLIVSVYGGALGAGSGEGVLKVPEGESALEVEGGNKQASVDVDARNGVSVGKMEAGKDPIEYVGEVTKWFAIYTSIILGAFALLITVAQISLGVHLARNEKSTRQELNKQLSIGLENQRREFNNEVQSRRLEFEMMRGEFQERIHALVGEHIKEKVDRFDKLVASELDRAIQSRVRVDELIYQVGKERLVSMLQEWAGEEGQVALLSVREKVVQWANEVLHLRMLSSAEETHIFTGLGYLKATLSVVPPGQRPIGVVELLRELDGKNRFRNPGHYAIATEICRDLYGEPLVVEFVEQ